MRAIFAAIAALVLFPCAASALEYKAFDGMEGYQSIRVSDDVHYVAYHGSRDTSVGDVSAGWSARSAQICRDAGRGFYVELAYVFEPLTPAEIRKMESSEAEPAAIPARGAGGAPIYIPIYTPSGPRVAMINAPSRLGAIRCVPSPADLADQERAVSVSKQLEESRAAGLKIEDAASAGKLKPN
jgi:hypothetical protein